MAAGRLLIIYDQPGLFAHGKFQPAAEYRWRFAYT
jgi:hypothetical protein